MRNGQKIDLGMTGYAELFMTDEERKTQTLPRIVDIPIEMITMGDQQSLQKVYEAMQQMNRLMCNSGTLAIDKDDSFTTFNW